MVSPLTFSWGQNNGAHQPISSDSSDANTNLYQWSQLSTSTMFPHQPSSFGSFDPYTNLYPWPQLSAPAMLPPQPFESAFMPQTSYR